MSASCRHPTLLYDKYSGQWASFACVISPHTSFVTFLRSCVGELSGYRHFCQQQTKWVPKKTKKKNKQLQNMASNESKIEFKPYRSRNSWSPYKLGKLIKLYRLSPALWDTKHNSFLKRDARKQAYLHIAEFFGKKNNAGVDLISRKINTLRNTFKIELEKVQAGGRSQWEFYELLTFLTDHVKKVSVYSKVIACLWWRLC